MKHYSSQENQKNESIAITIADTQCGQQGLSAEDQQAALLKPINHSSMAHFKIIDILGKGGMAAVYKAKDLTLERFVAIKMIRLSNTKQPLMLAEAKTISQLNHPNIVTVYDIARDDDANFIVMEWVNGRPLNAVIPPDGLALKKVLAYAKQMVAAIACAHQQYIIHRDIKPQNIMLDVDGRIKILDFGIASLIDPKLLPVDRVTKTEHSKPQQRSSEAEVEVIGSPQYMAPEQIQGQGCDARSDLFSFGIVLYEMLTGVKPFLGLNFKQISQAITSGQYIPLAEVYAEQKILANTKHKAENKTKDKPALPIELIAVVDKLLQVEPYARYQSAQDLAHDIKIIDEKFHHKNTWWQQQHWLTKTLLLIPVIVMLGWSMHRVLFPPSTQELIAQQLEGSKKIAFLPFDNISGDPVLQLFSDAMATMLSSDLAEVGYQQSDGNTWVLPASEIRQLEDASIAGVYNEYGVDVIVTGSIQHMGSTRSLHLSLVNASDGRQLKSLQLTLDANKLFDSQSQIRQQVMTLLGWQIPLALSQQFAAKKPAFDGAYQYYLQGQGYLYRFDHGDNITKALASFQRAITLDQNYADAYVGLAQAQLRSFIEYQDTDFLVKMANTVAQLTQIDSDHHLLSYLQGELRLNQGDYRNAASLFKQSIDLQPNFLKAYAGLSDSYIALGEFAQAEQVLLTAFEIMPNNSLGLVNLGAFHYQNGDYRRALDYFELLAQQTPNNYTAYLNISACHYLIGDFNKALISAEQALKIQPNFIVYSNIGTFYFMLRDYDKAVDAYEKMIALNDSDYINWGNLADAYRFANNEKYKVALQKAIILAEQAIKLNPNNKYAIALLSYYYANLNDIDKTNYYAKQISQSDAGVDNFFIAAAYARLSMKAAAMKHLSFAINNNYSLAEIVNSPLFDSLKNEATFRQLTLNVSANVSANVSD